MLNFNLDFQFWMGWWNDQRYLFVHHNLVLNEKQESPIFSPCSWMKQELRFLLSSSLDVVICSWIDVLTGTEPIYRKAERSLFPNKSDKYITSDQSHDWDCAHFTLYIYRVSKKTEFSGQFQQIMVISIRSNVWHFYLMFNTLNLV